MIKTLTLGHPNPAVSTGEAPHILLVVDQLSSTLGGGERIILKLAALLPGYGYKVSILTFSSHPESRALHSAPCPIYLLPLTKAYNLASFKAALEFRKFLYTEKIQLVQTFFESSDIWAGLVTKTMPGIKLVWSRRDMGILRSRKHGIAYRLMSSFPDAVFAVSEQVRRHCIEVDRIPAGRVQTIYNGLNMASWESRVQTKVRQQVHITTVGNIRRVKGHDIFIRAASQIAAVCPDATFSIGGEVLEQGYFLELGLLVQELQLCDKIRFVGCVTDLQQHLSDADIFVLPSRSEGFSNAIIEAMAASLPVVATDVGGNSEAVQDGISGFIVPTEDPQRLFEAIMQLLSDPTKSRDMGEAGRRIVIERFTTEAMMRKTTEAYQLLLGQN